MTFSRSHRTPFLIRSGHIGEEIIAIKIKIIAIKFKSLSDGLE